MRVVEFRIPLPLGVEEYQISQLYMVAHASLEDTKNSPEDGVQCLKAEGFENDELGQGYFTHKRISIAGKIPGWILSVVSREWLTLEEKSWNRFPRVKTRYECPMLSGLIFTVESMHHEGICTHNNALNLSSELLALRKVVVVDIINDKVPPKDYNQDEDPTKWHSKKGGIGPLKANWEKTIPKVMTCYKVFLLDLPLGWFSGKVENWVLSSLESVLLVAHRRCVCWMDRWYSMTLADVRRLEEQVKAELDKIWKLKKGEAEEGEEELEITEESDSSILGSSIEFYVTPGENEIASEIQAAYLHSMDSLKNHHPLGYRYNQCTHVDLLEVLDPTSLLAHRKQSFEENQIMCPNILPETNENSQQSEGLLPTNSPSSPQYSSSFHEGFLYKLSGGFFSTVWNLRFVVLRKHLLEYYLDPKDPTPRDVFDLTGASVTWQLEEVGDRQHALSVVPVVGNRREIFLSGETVEETKQWLLWLQLASLSGSIGPIEQQVLQGELHPSPPASKFARKLGEQEQNITESRRMSHPNITALTEKEEQQSSASRPSLVHDSDFISLVKELVDAGKVANTTATHSQGKNYQYVGSISSVRVYVRNIKQWITFDRSSDHVQSAMKTFQGYSKRKQLQQSGQGRHHRKHFRIGKYSLPSSVLTTDQCISYISVTWKLYLCCLASLVRFIGKSEMANCLDATLISEVFECFYAHPGRHFEFYVVPFIVAVVAAIVVKTSCRLSPFAALFLHYLTARSFNAFIRLAFLFLFSLAIFCGLAVWTDDVGKFLCQPMVTESSNIECSRLRKMPHVALGSITMVDVPSTAVFRALMESQHLTHWLSDVKKVQQRRQGSPEARHHCDYTSETFSLPTHTQSDFSSLVSTYLSSPASSVLPAVSISSATLISNLVQNIICSSIPTPILRRWNSTRYWGVFSDGSIFVISYNSNEAINQLSGADAGHMFANSSSPKPQLISSFFDNKMAIKRTNVPKQHLSSHQMQEDTASTIMDSSHTYVNGHSQSYPSQSTNQTKVTRLANRILSISEALVSTDVNITQSNNTKDSILNCRGIIGWLISPRNGDARSCQVTELIGFDAAAGLLPSIFNEHFILHRLKALNDLYLFVRSTSTIPTPPIIPKCVECLKRLVSSESSTDSNKDDSELNKQKLSYRDNGYSFDSHNASISFGVDSQSICDHGINGIENELLNDFW